MNELNHIIQYAEAIFYVAIGLLITLKCYYS